MQLALPEPILRNTVPLAENFSIAPALEISAQLAPFTSAVKEIEDQAKRVVINSQEAFQRGTEFLSICKQHATQLETFRVTVKRPIDDYGKFIQALFKPLIDRLDVVSRAVGRTMLTFQEDENKKERDRQEAIRRQQEEEATRLAEERAKAGDTAGADAILEAATMAPVPLPPPRMATTNSFGQRAQTTTRWVGSVNKPLEVLRAILEGKVPISVIEWRQIELNRIASSIKIEGVHAGIKVTKEGSLGVRR